MNRLPFELLKLARRLLGRATAAPNQASLRRAISTAYYAIFHLLTLEAGGIFVGRTETVELIVRAYDHGEMARVSRFFAEGNLPRMLVSLGRRFSDKKEREKLEKLKAVADAFVKLQDARHRADYDLTARYDRSEATRLVDLAELAFSDWKGIREDDLARIYLSSFLVFKDWHKER
jgi:uncharacterized protein (UPF0332 family)